MARKTRKGRAVKVPVQVEQVAQVEEQVVEVESDASTVQQGTVEAPVTEAQAEQAKPTKQAKVKEPKPAPAPKAPTGAGAALKLLLFKDPSLTVQQLMDALGDAAPSKQTVSLVRYETVSALRLLKQEGFLVETLAAKLP